MNSTALVSGRLLRRDEAARHIYENWGYPCSPRTLAKYAVIGGGPRFRKVGRYPLYHPDDLDVWLKSKLSEPVTSTSALATARVAPFSGAQSRQKTVTRWADSRPLSTKESSA